MSVRCQLSQPGEVYLSNIPKLVNNHNCNCLLSDSLCTVKLSTDGLNIDSFSSERLGTDILSTDRPKTDRLSADILVLIGLALISFVLIGYVLEAKAIYKFGSTSLYIYRIGQVQ